RPAPVRLNTYPLKQRLSAFDLDCLKLVGAKAEKLQNGRGDLCRLHRSGDIQARRRSGPYNEDRYISVLEMISTVLGDLAFMASVDDAVLSNTDHIRNPGITLVNPNELRCGYSCIDLDKTGGFDGFPVDTCRWIVVLR